MKSNSSYDPELFLREVIAEGLEEDDIALVYAYAKIRDAKDGYIIPWPSLDIQLGVKYPNAKRKANAILSTHSNMILNRIFLETFARCKDESPMDSHSAVSDSSGVVQTQKTNRRQRRRH